MKGEKVSGSEKRGKIKREKVCGSESRGEERKDKRRIGEWK